MLRNIFDSPHCVSFVGSYIPVSSRTLCTRVGPLENKEKTNNYDLHSISLIMSSSLKRSSYMKESKYAYDSSLRARHASIKGTGHVR